MKAIAAVRSDDGFDLWHHVTCRDYSITECRLSANAEFRGAISIKSMGVLALSIVSSATAADAMIQVARRPEEIRRDPRDHFMLWLMLRGQIGVAQEGRAATMRAGDLFLYDQSLPFALEFGREARALMITVPRPLWSERLPSPRDLVARRVPAGSQLAGLAGSVMRRLYRVEHVETEDVAQRLGMSALDMLAATLESEIGDAACAAGGRPRLAAMKRRMLARLPDPAFDLARFAAAEGVAPRTLYRLFAAEGTTPMRWLWQQRLAAAYRRLADGRAETVTAAAMSVGFSDVSHFSRAFKAAYGRSPRDLVRR